MKRWRINVFPEIIIYMYTIQKSCESEWVWKKEENCPPSSALQKKHGAVHDRRWYKWDQQVEGTFVGKAVQGPWLPPAADREQAVCWRDGEQWVNRAWMTEGCRDLGWRDFSQSFRDLSRLSFGSKTKQRCSQECFGISGTIADSSNRTVL